MGSRHRGKWIIVILCGFITLHGQIGGRYAFEFLSLQPSARVTALGTTLIGVIDDDVNLAYTNPANLNAKMNGSFSVNRNIHFADIAHSYAGYAHQINKWGVTTHLALNTINYGNFVNADEFGNNNGSFSAHENALIIGAAKSFYDKINLGVNVKTVFATYESKRSAGVAADFGLNYISVPDKTIISLLVRNAGSQLSTFDESARKATPLDIQIGISNKLRHLPFRYSIIAHQLQRWNIRYDDPSQVTVDIFGTDTGPTNFEESVDNFFRHFVFSGEFLLGKRENLRLRAGYNHLRRSELRNVEFRSLAGFSLGFGLKIYKFRFDYGVGYHHLAGAVNHLTISSNISEFKRGGKTVQ